MAQKESRDALQMLADDHRTVEALFEKYDNARGEAAQELPGRDLRQQIEAGAAIEERDEHGIPRLRG